MRKVSRKRQVPKVLPFCFHGYKRQFKSNIQVTYIIAKSVKIKLMEVEPFICIGIRQGEKAITYRLFRVGLFNIMMRPKT